MPGFGPRQRQGKAYCCGMSRHQRKEGDTLNLKGVGYSFFLNCYAVVCLLCVVCVIGIDIYIYIILKKNN